MQRHFHYLFHAAVRNDAGSSRPRSVFLQRGNATLQKAVPPPRHLLRHDAHLRGDLFVFQTIGRSQYDACPFHKPSRQRTLPRNPLQSCFLFRVQSNWGCDPHTVPLSTVWTKHNHNRYYLQRTTLALMDSQLSHRHSSLDHRLIHRRGIALVGDPHAKNVRNPRRIRWLQTAS
jgi:hypothetical protein